MLNNLGKPQEKLQKSREDKCSGREMELDVQQFGAIDGLDGFASVLTCFPDHSNFFVCSTMLNALWQFTFPPKHQPEPLPLQQPRKYSRTQDPSSSGLLGEAQANAHFTGSNNADGIPMQPYPQAFHPNQSDVHLPLPKTL
jgi:hypothetical protein